MQKNIEDELIIYKCKVIDINESRYSSTSVASDPLGRINSQVTHHENVKIWVLLEDGREHCLPFYNKGLTLRVGNIITVIHNKRSGNVERIINHNTGQYLSLNSNQKYGRFSASLASNLTALFASIPFISVLYSLVFLIGSYNTNKDNILNENFPKKATISFILSLFVALIILYSANVPRSKTYFELTVTKEEYAGIHSVVDPILYTLAMKMVDIIVFFKPDLVTEEQRKKANAFLNMDKRITREEFRARGAKFKEIYGYQKRTAADERYFDRIETLIWGSPTEKAIARHYLKDKKFKIEYVAIIPLFLFINFFLFRSMKRYSIKSGNYYVEELDNYCIANSYLINHESSDLLDNVNKNNTNLAPAV